MKWVRRILAAILGLVVLAVAGLAVALSHTSPCGTAPATAIADPMKLAVNRCYGTPDVIRVESFPKPVAGDHGVVVQVHASSVNPLDWHFLLGEPYLMRSSAGFGSPKDIMLGTDFAGTVVSVGKQVTKFKPGDEVFGTGDGAFAQYMLSPDDAAIVLKPANVSFEEAAAVPVAGVTALQGLRDVGKVKPGQKVLINGAGGGVGTFAVQIAKAFGATVTAVTNTGSLPLMQTLGADHVIDYTREDFTAGTQQYDVIFDLSGNHPMSDYRRALTPTGIYVMAGANDKGAWLGPLKAMGRTMIAAKFAKQQQLLPFFANVDAMDMAVLADMMQKGQVKPVIDRRFSLEQVADAFRYQMQSTARGKVVITVN